VVTIIAKAFAPFLLKLKAELAFTFTTCKTSNAQEESYN